MAVFIHLDGFGHYSPRWAVSTPRCNRFKLGGTREVRMTADETIPGQEVTGDRTQA